MSLSDHDFERIMICAAEAGISDVHFHPGEPVFWRRYGDLSPLREYVPCVEDLWRIFTRITSESFPCGPSSSRHSSSYNFFL